MDPITDKEDVKYYLGRSYAKKKHYGKAIKAYKQGLTINPKSVILLFAIGSAYSKVNDRRQAVKYWKRLLSVISPHSYLAVQIKQKRLIL